MARTTGRPISTGNVFEAADGTWSFRYRNAPGLKPVRPTVRGFESRSAAFAAYLAKTEEIERAKTADADERKALAMKEWKLDAYVRYFVEQYDGADSTRTKLGHLLRKATDEFGATKLRDLSTPRLRTWRRGLTSAQHEAFQALRQLLAQAVAEQIIPRNPTDGIRNSKRSRAEVEAFTTWADVVEFADEFSTHYQPMIRFWAATGLRPAEIFALEWRDIDLDGRRLHVRRALVAGVVKPVKTKASARTVPLNAKAREAIEEVLARSESREGLVFTTAIGTPINLHRWRGRTWKDAVEAAGYGGRTPYVLRHTYATLALRSEQSTFEVARWMGTSIAMIDAHSGHLAADSLDAEIDKFDRYVDTERPREGLRLVA